MKNRVFVDTNILIYHFKRDIARYSTTTAILTDANTDLVTSAQVISEFANVCLKKKFVASGNELKQYIAEITSLFEVADFVVGDITKAIDIQARYKLSFYDSLIISNALTANCTTIYSEDFHHNLKVERKLKVINPFK